MSDIASQIAEWLCEGSDLPSSQHLEAETYRRWPSATPADIRRALAIAVEIVLTDRADRP